MTVPLLHSLVVSLSLLSVSVSAQTVSNTSSAFSCVSSAPPVWCESPAFSSSFSSSSSPQLGPCVCRWDCDCEGASSLAVPDTTVAVVCDCQPPTVHPIEPTMLLWYSISAAPDCTVSYSLSAVGVTPPVNVSGVVSNDTAVVASTSASPPVEVGGAVGLLSSQASEVSVVTPFQFDPESTSSPPKLWMSFSLSGNTSASRLPLTFSGGVLPCAIETFVATPAVHRDPLGSTIDLSWDAYVTAAADVLTITIETQGLGDGWVPKAELSGSAFRYSLVVDKLQCDPILVRAYTSIQPPGFSTPTRCPAPSQAQAVYVRMPPLSPTVVTAVFVNETAIDVSWTLQADGLGGCLPVQVGVSLYNSEDGSPIVTFFSTLLDKPLPSPVPTFFNQMLSLSTDEVAQYGPRFFVSVGVSTVAGASTTQSSDWFAVPGSSASPDGHIPTKEIVIAAGSTAIAAVFIVGGLCYMYRRCIVNPSLHQLGSSSSGGGSAMEPYAPLRDPKTPPVSYFTHSSPPPSPSSTSSAPSRV